MHTNAAGNTRSAAPNSIETNKITHVNMHTNAAKKKNQISSTKHYQDSQNRSHKKNMHTNTAKRHIT
jgi:hypothetical protein